MAYVRVVADGVEVDLWVVPRSSRAALGPLEPARGCLRAAVNAPPVDGAANVAVRELVADALAVPKSQVQLIRGATARKKTLRVLGPPALLLSRVQALAGGPETG